MIEPGLKGCAQAEAVFSNSASAMGSGSLEVFATPAMVALMEKAALESVQPFLEAGQTTVGTGIDVSHLAATPLGMTVIAESELLSVEGRDLEFQVTAHAGGELIGRGRHRRCIVSADRFLAKANRKKQG